MIRPAQPLSEADLDRIIGGGRVSPYGNFNFKVEFESGAATFDGRLLTADDFRQEQTTQGAAFSDVSGLGTEVIIAE